MAAAATISPPLPLLVQQRLSMSAKDPAQIVWIRTVERHEWVLDAGAPQLQRRDSDEWDNVITRFMLTTRLSVDEAPLSMYDAGKLTRIVLKAAPHLVGQILEQDRSK